MQHCLPVMLIDVLGVMIPVGQVGLQILFDVMLDAQAVDRIQDTMGVGFPICCPGHGQVVSSTDFVKVYELMGMLDDLQTGFSGQGRLKANPGEDTRIVKSLEGADSITGQLCPPFPFAAESIVQTGKRRSEGVTTRAEHRQKRKSAAAAFGQGAKAKSVFHQHFQCRTGQADVKRVERVGGERKHTCSVIPQARYFIASLRRLSR